MIKILYEDNHLIAVYKPAGVLVQGDETGDSTLMDEVKLYIKQKYNKPCNVFLGLLHRLDRPVSGIILFAKTSKGASRLSEQFRAYKIKKIYHALVEGEVKEKSG
ncbi:MAG: RluA family pseudouridine synthase, partial [Candidatus Magasanikbacteria bacterium]|nr:RluA family pseudouridine synthase [Candidatus Magasanikbacteria bacterium]